MTEENDAPPPLEQMFINSSDTLRRREINQKIPSEWNDRPPLLHVQVPQRRRIWGRNQSKVLTEDEDRNLLKGVSMEALWVALRWCVALLLHCGASSHRVTFVH
jgi:hypothetical protein